MTDDVHVGRLSKETRAAIADYLCAIGRDDLADRRWWEFNEFCGLWFRLSIADDTPQLFPKGKSATLQCMRDMIEEAART